MKKNITTLMVGLMVLVLSACSGGVSKSDVETMGVMKKMVELKITAEQDGKPTPPFEEVRTAFSVAPGLMAATEHWASTNAPSDAVILYIEKNGPDKGPVARQDGSIIRL